MLLPDTELRSAPPVSQEEPEIGQNDLQINVLGASFSISAGEEPAYLEEVLAQYQVAVANTQGISGMKDPLKVAILTGFLLCDEINKLKLHFEEEKAKSDLRRKAEAQEINRVTRNTIARIDQLKPHFT
ncbi:MAG: cell division protein ZapA [Treponema sp.]|jgi:cell division protein ZapA (FtsZ GTPase activity inhibitor)|nr:cell division protein ZapA [Treponema sp.]